MGLYAIESCFLCGLSIIIRSVMEQANIHYLLILVVSGGFFIGSILVLNLKEIKKCFMTLNEINKSA